MNVIRSQLYDVYTEEVNKVALSANDDKRLIMKDGISTLAYGHYNTPAAIENALEMNQERLQTDHYPLEDLWTKCIS